MKKNKIQKLLFVFLIGIVLGTTIKASAQFAPSFKNYTETFYINQQLRQLEIGIVMMAIDYTVQIEILKRWEMTH